MDQLLGTAASGLKRLLLGRRLATREQERKKIGWVAAVPAMGLDALGSAAYGPEAALTALMPLGAAAAGYLAPILALIVVLLILLYISYRQTIGAYDQNAGGYVVARENLGRTPSLVAAAALIVDYVLNVAVGISAGVAALVSAMPPLQPFVLPLCLGILLVITLAHLRGTGEAGWLFSLPTYLYIACFLGAIGWAVAQIVLTHGTPPVAAPPPPAPAATTAVSLWLLMHAFASGCTAMTGVEAVSNGIGAFREPAQRHAGVTLTIIVAVLALLLAGIGAAAAPYHLVAMDQQQPGYRTVLSQLLEAVAGRGAFYYVGMASLLGVLCLSASTSFVGFPRVCRLVAADGYLPRVFAAPGRRLVYTAGILFLGGAAGVLITVFGGITDRLIPLFALGAFLTFTLSQAGMVVHWKRQGGRHWPKLLANGLGAAATSVALLVMLATKFTQGAWIVLFAVPVIVLALGATRRYYDEIGAELSEPGPIDVEQPVPPTVLVVTKEWNRLSERAIKFGLTISPDVVAVHMSRLEGDDETWEADLRDRWRRKVEAPLAEAGIAPPRLMLLPAPYRQIEAPLFRLIDRLDEEAPERAIAVLIPETVPTSWWQALFHRHRAARLRSLLLRWNRPNLTVVSIPWRLMQEETSRNGGDHR